MSQGEVSKRSWLKRMVGGVFLRSHTNDLKKELIGCALHGWVGVNGFSNVQI